MRLRACILRARPLQEARPSSGWPHRGCCGEFDAADGYRATIRIECCVAKKPEPVDDLLDALVWMRRKAKRHEAVDDLIDALMKMRRKAKHKLAKRKRPAKKRTKSRR